MELRIKNKVYAAMAATLAPLHPKQSNKYDDAGDYTLDLSTLTRKEVDSLFAELQGSDVKGVKVILADLRRYIKAADEGIDVVQARTCRQAAWMLEHYFAALPHHLIFSLDDYEGNSHTGYYVADVDYEPYKPGDSRRDRVPEHVDIDLVWIEDEQTKRKRLSFEPGECVGLTCKEMLAGEGYVPESPALIAKLAAETDRFYNVCAGVGVQHIATGLGLADLDDASHEKRASWHHNRVKMNNFGVESRVVVDVLYELDSEKSQRGGRSTDFDIYRWHDWNLRFFSPSEEVLARHLEADEDSAERPIVQVPVHPLVPCFDLKRHLRLRVHVNNLTPYEYNRSAADGLVLPEVDRKMIDLLVDQSQNTFQDIVSGKGSSMNILSSGKPGTGKTVTAEVFAEFKGRPLYTVQCSQLGLEPDEVEKALSVILQRANRWNAVLLLDEADVYIRRRAADIQQNAIVGVFLRVLEYASCILFMTTNLPQDVDDAIASRCIIHLHYQAPDVADQVRIWEILADRNGLDLSTVDIEGFAATHHQLSGRDVKNLLKLASFVVASGPITYEALELALKFKPTLE
jgi:hypothetical protein